MSREIFPIILVLIILASPIILAGNYIALQGNVKESGIALSSGNLSVLIYDNETAGTLVYNSTSDSVYNSVGNSISDSVMNAGIAAVHIPVWRSVDVAVWISVWNSVKNSIKTCGSSIGRT